MQNKFWNRKFITMKKIQLLDIVKGNIRNKKLKLDLNTSNIINKCKINQEILLSLKNIDMNKFNNIVINIWLVMDKKSYLFGICQWLSIVVEISIKQT